MSVVDRHGTMQTGIELDPLGVAMRDQAAAMLAYWEGRLAAHPTHVPTLRTRDSWRMVVRCLEDYYSLPRSFETKRDRTR